MTDLRSRIMAKVNSLNAWYDVQKEPGRFFLFIIPFITMWAILQFGVIFHHSIATAIGLVLIGSMIAIAMIRAFGFAGYYIATSVLGACIFAAVYIVIY